MKTGRILLIAIIFLNTIFINAQDIPQLNLTRNGVEPIVVEIPGVKANELYKKALNWVEETYSTPKEVLKAKIEGKKIRISGFSEDAWWYKHIGPKQEYDMTYSLEIYFKDGKYRFIYVIDQFYADGAKVLYTYRTFFKKKGTIRKSYKDAIPSLEETMNNLSTSFYKYVTGVTEKNDEDW